MQINAEAWNSCWERSAMQHHVRSWWGTLPKVTKFIFALCIGVFVVTSVLPAGIFQTGPTFLWCLNFSTFLHSSGGTSPSPPSVGVAYAPHLVVSMFLSPFAHADIFHLIFNMMAWVNIAAHDEATLGPRTLVLMVVALVAGTELTQLLFEAIFKVGTRFCTLGLSGVLFGLISYRCFLPENRDVLYDCCGLAKFKARVYPFVLALFMALLFPTSSLLGHLSGIAFGAMLAVFVSQHALQSFAGKAFGRCSCLDASASVPSLNEYGHQAGGGPSSNSLFPGLPQVNPPGPLTGPVFAPFAGTGRVLSTGAAAVTAAGASATAQQSTSSSTSSSFNDSSVHQHR